MRKSLPLACLAILVLLACDPVKRVEDGIARAIARGDYEGARKIALDYMPADLDIARANARMVLINAEESRAYLPSVGISGDSSWVRDGDNVRVTSGVMNTGSKAIRFIEVQAVFLDDAGQIVATASGSFSVTIAPGGTRAFEIVRRDPAPFTTVTTRVEDIRVW